MAPKFLKKYRRFDKNKSKVIRNSYGGSAPAIRCYNYKKEGHTRKMFPERLNIHGRKDNGNATVVEDDYESFDFPLVSSSDSSKEWIMDSACTWHMTPNKDVFEE